MSSPVRHRGDRLYLWCPGCQELHWVTFGPDGWTWDGDLESPTISPSILMRARYWEPPVTPDNLDQWKREPWEQQPVERVCHSFVRAGVWEFLGDCTHALAGQHVPMADVEPQWPWADLE